MPGLRLHAGTHALKGTKEPKARRVVRKPKVQRRERSARGKLLPRQLDLIACFGRFAVNQVDIRAPVMAACARQRRPQQNGVDAFPRRQCSGVELYP